MFELTARTVSGVVTACAKCAMHTQKSEFRPHFVLLKHFFFNTLALIDFLFLQTQKFYPNDATENCPVRPFPECSRKFQNTFEGSRRFFKILKH
jgi:hypothetical protein